MDIDLWLEKALEQVKATYPEELLAQLESYGLVKPKSNWIKCSEEMPEKFTSVLAFEEGHISIMQWNGGKYWQEVGTNDDFLIPTHWQPLPPPPEDN